MYDRVAGEDPQLPLTQSALWKTAYQKYFRLWLNLARSADLSEDEAKDVVQGVIAGILSDPSREFSSLEHVRNYVAKSVLNRVKAAHTRGNRHLSWGEEAELRYAVHEEDNRWDESRRKETLRRLIRRLPRRDFNILKLRFYSGFTLAQTGELLGMPLSTIASRETVLLRRIRARLRKIGY